MIWMCPNSSESEIGWKGSAGFVGGFGIGGDDHVQVQLQVQVESEDPVGERRRSKTYIVYFSWVNLKKTPLKV